MSVQNPVALNRKRAGFCVLWLSLVVEGKSIKDDPLTVYVIGAGALVVCLSKQISLGAVKGIAALKDELNPELMRVVFKDSGFKD